VKLPHGIVAVGLLAIASWAAPHFVASMGAGVAVLAAAFLGLGWMSGARQEQLDKISGALAAGVVVATTAPWMAVAVDRLLRSPYALPLLVLCLLVAAVPLAGRLLAGSTAAKKVPAPPKLVRGRRGRVVRDLEGPRRPEAQPALESRDPNRDDLGLLP